MDNPLLQKLDIAWTTLSKCLQEYRANWRQEGAQALYEKCLDAQKRFDAVIAECQEYRERYLRL